MSDITNIEETAESLHRAADSIKKIGGAIDSTLDLKTSTDALLETVKKLVVSIETMTVQSQSKADQTIQAISELTKATERATAKAHEDAQNAARLAKMQAHASVMSSFYDQNGDLISGFKYDNNKQEMLFDLARLYNFKPPEMDQHNRKIQAADRAASTIQALKYLTIGYTYAKDSYQNLSP